MSSPSFYDAKKRPPSKSGMNTPNPDGSYDHLSLGQIQMLIYEVQAAQEESVEALAALIDEFVEAESTWKAHSSKVSLVIRDRMIDTREKSSADLREAEIFETRSEEGELGLVLYKNYRLLEERVKVADKHYRMLEKRGGLLQTLSANLRDVG